MEFKRGSIRFGLKLSLFLIATVLPNLSLANSCGELYSRLTLIKPQILTKGEIASAVFLTIGAAEKGKSESQIVQESKNAVRILRNHRIQSLPQRVTWGFEEVMISDRNLKREDLEKASDRLNGLERTFNKTLVPERDTLEYAADGVTLVGKDAIFNFLNRITKTGHEALNYRNQFLKGATINLYDYALNGIVAAPALVLPLKYLDSFNSVLGEYGSAAAYTAMAIGGATYMAAMTGFPLIRPVVNYKVKKAESFGRLYTAVTENIHHAIDNTVSERWLYWGLNAQIPRDYLWSLMNPDFLPQAHSKNAHLTFPYNQNQKNALLEGAADLALDLMFKFEAQPDGTQQPTLTIFTRYAVPADPPPPRHPKKKKEINLKPNAEWLPALVPVGIPSR